MTQPPGDMPDWITSVGRNQRQVSGSPFAVPANSSASLSITLSATAHGILVGTSPLVSSGSVQVTGNQSGIIYGQRSLNYASSVFICPVSPVLDTSVTVHVFTTGGGSTTAYVAELDDVISTGEYAPVLVAPQNTNTSWIAEPPSQGWQINPSPVTGAQLSAWLTVSGLKLHVVRAVFGVANTTGANPAIPIFGVYDGVNNAGTLLGQIQLAIPATVGAGMTGELADLDCASGSIYIQSSSFWPGVQLFGSAWGYLR